MVQGQGFLTLLPSKDGTGNELPLGLTTSQHHYTEDHFFKLMSLVGGVDKVYSSKKTCIFRHHTSVYLISNMGFAKC